MTDTHDLRVSARTAQLLASDDNGDNGPPWRFSGVAVAAGDILHMDDGTPVLFTEENLRAAAETQTGEPLTVDHPADEAGRPQYPPPTDETVGKVPKAGWLDNVQGVAYEASTHDENVAKGVQAGSYEVSVHPQFGLGEKDPETGAYIAEKIKFRDLSVVSKGDSPSNTVEWGPSQALASFTQSTDIGDELTAAEDADDGGIRELVERLAERAGIIDSNDFRGGVHLPDQTTDGEAVDLEDAGFEDAPWMVTLHGPGDEYPDVGEGLGPELGSSEPYDAGDYEASVSIELDESLEEDQTLYALLRYHADGEVSDAIPTSDGGFYLDSAFVGVAPDGVMDGEDAEATASAGNEGAESSVDPDTSTMDENTRQQYISFLTANAGFDEESVSAMDDGALKQTYELAAEDGGSTDDDPTDDPADGATGDRAISEMTVGELGDALRDQGFVTEDEAGDLVAEAQDRQSKAEKVEEIVAKSDDYEEDDRESLMASADTLVDREHKRIRGELAAGIPGNAGQAATLTAGAGGNSGAVDEYGTGVKED